MTTIADDLHRRRRRLEAEVDALRKRAGDPFEHRFARQPVQVQRHQRRAGLRLVLGARQLRRPGPWLALVIALVGITDVIFAVDSIPAIFAITSDPFIVLTSNIFAILGLRAMYFLLAAVAYPGTTDSAESCSAYSGKCSISISGLRKISALTTK